MSPGCILKHKTKNIQGDFFSGMINFHAYGCGHGQGHGQWPEITLRLQLLKWQIMKFHYARMGKEHGS